LRKLAEEIPVPEKFMGTKKATFLLIGWGSTLWPDPRRGLKQGGAIMEKK